MNESQFWSLLDASLAQSQSSAAQADFLREALSQQDQACCLDFYRQLREKMALLNTVELMAATLLIHHSTTPDVFRHFRAWLVCRGRARFEQVLGDVSSIAAFLDSPQVDALDGRLLLEAAEAAYETYGGFEDEFYAQAGKVAEHSLHMDWPEDWDGLARRWPALYQKFALMDAGASLQ